MEEILASIRRIIAEDGDGGAAEEKPGRGEEVLELTEVVEEDGSVVSLSAGPKKAIIEPPAPAPSPPAPPPPAAKRVAPEPAFAVEQASPPPRPEPAPPKPELRPVAAEGGLVSSAAAAASVSALAQLAAVPQPRDQLGGMPLGDPGRTLEQLIRDLLTPMLKQWLDSNLPSLVERLVQEEIQRMSRQAQGR